MKLALIGYGRMGRAIDEAAQERGHDVALKIDTRNQADITDTELAACDAAIEFTHPESAADNIRRCLRLRLPVVVGTTGWYDEYEALNALCRDNKAALLTATNFSIGVNILFALNDKLTAPASRHGYSFSIEETHHIHKRDAPSGTAITLAEGLLRHYKGEKELDEWVSIEDDSERVADKNELPIYSFREGEVPGTHIIRAASEIDTLELKHTAHSRKGFATGAVIAAEWLVNRTGVYTMKDVLSL